MMIALMLVPRMGRHPHEGRRISIWYKHDSVWIIARNCYPPKDFPFSGS